MSAFESQDPFPTCLIRAMAWLMVAQWREKSSLGMRLLMLGMVLPQGAERSIMMHFLPEHFLVAIPRGLMWKVGKEG